MELIDAHCHLDFPAFDGRREAVMREAAALGVVRLVIPGVRAADWQRVVSCAEVIHGIHYCLGIHPWFVQEHDWQDLERLRALLVAGGERCVGVGECGLDRLQGELSAQMPCFEAQIDIAGELKLPLVIHSVRAHDEVASVLKRKGFSGRALVHGFAGSYQQARKLVDADCMIGVGGIITYARARKTRDTLSRLPLSCLVLETDAPDMPPAGVAAGGNSPVYLPDFLMELAQLRGEPAENMAQVLYANACRLYGWPE